MPSSHQLCPDGFECRSHSLLHRQACDLKSALPVSATAVRKSKEVERFRLTLSPTFAIGCGKSTKLDQPRLCRIQGQPKFRQPFFHCCQKPSGCFFTLESEHTVISVAHDNHISPCISATPLLRPLIESVMQVDVRQQWRYHRALGCALGRRYPAPVLHHPRFEPFTDQSQHSPIRNAVFQKLQHPVMIDFIKERRYVCIQYPVHVLALDSDRQRIQCIVLATPLPEPIRESKKVLFINRIQYGDYRLLHDFILQGGDSKRALSAIGFGYEYPP